MSTGKKPLPRSDDGSVRIDITIPVKALDPIGKRALQITAVGVGGLLVLYSLVYGLDLSGVFAALPALAGK